MEFWASQEPKRQETQEAILENPRTATVGEHVKASAWDKSSLLLDY